MELHFDCALNPTFSFSPEDGVLHADALRTQMAAAHAALSWHCNHQVNPWLCCDVNATLISPFVPPLPPPLPLPLFPVTGRRGGREMLAVEHR